MRKLVRWLRCKWIDHELKWIDDAILDEQQRFAKHSIWLRMMARERAVLLGRRMTVAQDRDPVNWNLGGIRR